MLNLFRASCIYSVLFFLVLGCSSDTKKDKENTIRKKGVELIVLGTVQDAGSPQIACTKNCCKKLFSQPDSSRRVVCLGIVDYETETKWLIEATPDIVKQIHHLNAYCSFSKNEVPDGILITHAHIGHYTGLMYLGKEAMNANNVPVYAMPKMSEFLKSNGPWSQLVENENIKISAINAELEIKLSKNITIIPIKVPHRDEFSETVGFKIIGPAKKVLFIPDIDKWQKWDKSIVEEIKACDYAFIDATFFDGEEI
ncbi:MAG: MBL fold metallo-hydrolase, partial [Bacteroidia bacterium]|nr:MBL fold metallo-hydrolase [Bacteroidia bacterium]